MLLAVNNNQEYFLVSSLNCQNSFLEIIIINDNHIIMIDSTKYIVCGLNFVSKCKIKNNCVDLIVEDNSTINEYLFILNCLKSIDGTITIIEARIAIKKVIKLALSVAININHIITGKIWNNIAKGCNTETFSLAYAALLRKYVKYKAIADKINNHHSK